MRYVLMLCSDVATGIDPESEDIDSGCGDWSETMARRGVLVTAAGLRPSDEAMTVRVRDGEVMLTDGPFAETKDQIGGFSMIECADLDEAIRLASRHPWAKLGQIEVRPVWEP